MDGRIDRNSKSDREIPGGRKMASVSRKPLPISNNLSPILVSEPIGMSSTKFSESTTLLYSNTGSSVPTNDIQNVSGGRHDTSVLPHRHQFELLLEGDEDPLANSGQLDWKRRFKQKRLSGFQRTSHRVKRHIGWWKLCIVVLGTLLILGLIGWLLFIWNETSESINSFWRWLILYDYLNISVVVSSALLRVAVAAQAAVATEMIASIVLERFGTKFYRSATLSMLRAFGSHPVDLVINWPFSSQAWPMIACAAILTLTTLSSQLSSALLVSDLKSATVQGIPQLSETMYGLGWDQVSILAKQDYSISSPSSFPMFAEFEDSSNPETEPGVDDTGAMIRAMLPISSVTIRQSISKYVGFATLLNPRVICLAPKVISTSFNFKTYWTATRKGVAPYIIGSISLGGIRPVGLDTSGVWHQPTMPANYSEELLYNCVLQTAVIPTEWPISLCIAYFASDQFLHISSPFSSADYFTPTYVMVNVSGTIPLAIAAREAPNITDWIYSSSSPSSPWTSIHSPSNPGFEINLSLCLTSFQAAEGNITATSSASRTEPALSALKNNSSHAVIDGMYVDGGDRKIDISYVFDTSNILLQLGADGSLSNYTTRGVLSLQKKSQWTKLRPASAWDTWGTVFQASDNTTAVLDGSFGFNDMSIQNLFDPRTNQTWGLCTLCGIYDKRLLKELDYYTKIIDIKLASIFQASLLKSRSPATALQALFTIASFQQYYDRVAYCQISNTTEITLFESHLQPVGHRGLSIVIVIVGVHLVFFLIVTVLFLQITKLSVLGDTWRSLAQLNSEDTQRLMQVSAMSTEREVEAWIDRNGLGDVLVRLEEQYRAPDGRRRVKLEKIAGKIS